MSDSAQTAPIHPLTVAADDVAGFAEHGTGALPAERAGMKRLVALVEAIEDDPAAFWSAVTPAQALALLKAAPRVAGPRQPALFQEAPTCRYGYEVARPRMIGVADDDNGARLADDIGRAEGWVLVDG